jgi:2-hydroxychromene-2-carboxylate isomerase
MPASPIVTMYFDPISPYAWLGAQALPAIEAAGAHVIMQPVLFAAMLDAHGQKGPAEVEAKRRYMFRDVMRQAALLEVPFRGPPGHPFNSLQALRLCLSISDQAQRRRFAVALMSAAWEHGENISAQSVLLRLADACGLDSAVLLDAAAQPSIKQQLRADTEAAIARGVFGVPTFMVDGELFWGSDRVTSLLAYMQGARIDEAVLAAFLARPALAQRTQ